MIIVRLQGGLGNQMFQYAFAKYHAIKNNCKLILDITPIRGHCRRPYELNYFNVKEETINFQRVKPSCLGVIDMYLMSICRHNIISNSTFSWWASWLNINSEKITIAPKTWSKGKIKNRRIGESIFDENWHLIQNRY